MTYRQARFISLLLLLLAPLLAHAEGDKAASDSIAQLIKNDSLNQTYLIELQGRIQTMDSLRTADSLARVELEQQLQSLRTSDNLQKQEILQQLKDIQAAEEERIRLRNQHIDSLKHVAVGYPVYGVLNDTITMLYVRLGAVRPEERARSISQRVRTLFEQDFSEKDTLTLIQSEGYIDIMFHDYILMTITDNDALWDEGSTYEYAKSVKDSITNSLIEANKEYSIERLVKRILLVLLALVVMSIVLFLVGRFFQWLKRRLRTSKDKLFKDLKYNDYTFLTVEQEMRLGLKLLTLLHWGTIIILFVVIIPVIFSIFPFTRGWSDQLFELILNPIRELLVAIWEYLPNLFNIAVVVIVIRYVVRFFKYIFSEIGLNRLKIPGFHPDFAKPTYIIVRSLLFVFAVILIFPYLPGAGSDAFNGISVFVGILVSLGSSSAISNMIAGIVITYMRPFKVGDRIKLEGIVGDVTEKTVLVTKLKTVTNEEVTIPNSKVLNSNTINYSALVKSKGLILSTEVTFGYEVPWRQVEQILVEAVLRCPHILPAPKPFVLQMSLDDFYITYTVNGYTTEANKQASIYSEIRGHIQDVCKEYDIELLSPYYQANRDGSMRTIPPEYTPPVKEEKPVPKVRGEE